MTVGTVGSTAIRRELKTCLHASIFPASTINLSIKSDGIARSSYLPQNISLSATHDDLADLGFLYLPSVEIHNNNNPSVRESQSLEFSNKSRGSSIQFLSSRIVAMWHGKVLTFSLNS